MKRTPLYDWHKSQGAKFTEFAGYDMPVIYTSIVQEHNAVRNAAGLFDISHMGQIFVEGARSLEFLQKLCTNDISKCKMHQGIYSHLCNAQGGVIDDIFVYWLSEDRWLVVVNASTAEKDYQWLVKNNQEGVKIDNPSEGLGMIALQGPSAEAIAKKIFKDIPARRYLVEYSIGGKKGYLCRTGYTGEDGFEVIVPNENLLKTWEDLLAAGKEFGVLPCGLGARDTLRLEAGYLLYGNDMDEEHTSMESGPGWVVKLGKPHFIGKEALAKQQNGQLKRKLLAFKLTERAVPRHGFKIFCDGKEAGVVSSGTFSPSLQQGIAMGYVDPKLSGKFSIECHNRQIPASLASVPFFSKPPISTSSKGA